METKIDAVAVLREALQGLINTPHSYSSGQEYWAECKRREDYARAEKAMRDTDALAATATIEAPTSEPVAMSPIPINDAEMGALERFHECVTDGEGWDVEKPMMQRLAVIGLVRRVTANFYEHTEFGLAMLDQWVAPAVASPAGQEAHASELPLAVTNCGDMSGTDDHPHAGLIETLRRFSEAYSTDFFPALTADERKQMGSLLDRASAGMGRHFAQYAKQAADALERSAWHASQSASVEDARDTAMEEAATWIESEICSCCWTEEAQGFAEHSAAAIRALKSGPAIAAMTTDQDASTGKHGGESAS